MPGCTAHEPAHGEAGGPAGRAAAVREPPDKVGHRDGDVADEEAAHARAREEAPGLGTAAARGGDGRGPRGSSGAVERADRRHHPRAAQLLRGSLLAGCALLGLLGVHQMQAGPAAGRSALNFPVGTLFGGPANWGRFLAAGGIVDPVGSSSPAAPAATAGMPVARPVVLRLAAFAAAPAAPAPMLASPPANFGSTDSSQLWPSEQQLGAAIAAASGSGGVTMPASLMRTQAPRLTPGCIGQREGKRERGEGGRERGREGERE